MSLKRHLFLCGFMGIGKTTAGKLLGDKLNCHFFDLDQMITQREGKTIAKIFLEDGEKHFRRLEALTLKNLENETPAVVALGGGTLKDPLNLDFVKRSGDLIYLSGKVETLETRLDNETSSRPLLDSPSDAERRLKINRMLQERKSVYKAAHFEVETDGLSPEQTADRIVGILRGGHRGS